MESSKVAWGIEVGDFALKAMRIQMVDDVVTVTDFAVIPHQRVLTDPSVSDRAGMIRVTLGAFTQQHAERLASEPIVMSLPGSVGFARFATIPAVDAKSMRKMVEYEARQQIPFPIEEVEWDSHMLAPDASGQCGIGIFAVTKERLQELLSLYSECGIEPDVLTLSSVAVYNALNYDLEFTESTAPIACLDVGTSCSDLVVVAGNKFWIRTFPVGGSHFTSAIADAFASQNVSYTRAEKIKIDRAPSEKILRARTMAMRRVTSQLVDEIGRSREFYMTSNEGVTLNRAFGVGSTLKISGLRTKIATDLQLTLERLEEFKRVQLKGPDAADFAAHSINLLTALGLALQGVGLAKVQLNLSPMARIRQKVWRSKMPWFITAAALLLVSSAAMFLRTTLDQIEISEMAAISGQASNTIKQGESLVSLLQKAQLVDLGGNADKNMLALLDNRDVWSYLVNDTYLALGASRPMAAELGADPAAILKIPAGDRRLIRLEEFAGIPMLDAERGERKIAVSVLVKLSNKDPTRFLNEANGVLDWLKTNRDQRDAPYTIDAESLRMPAWTKIQGGQRQEQAPDSNTTDSSAGGGFAMGTGGAARGSAAGGSGELVKTFRGPIQDGPGGFKGSFGSGDAGPGSGDADPNSAADPTQLSAGKRRARTIIVSADEKLPPVNLDKDAPLPEAPVLIGPTDVEYEGVLTFVVMLRASAPPTPTESAIQ